MSELSNRLHKNHRKFAAQFRSQGVEAWRLYGEDIPAYPYLIDLYGNSVVFWDRGSSEDSDLVAAHHAEAMAALQELFGPQVVVILKERRRQKGDDQYEVLDPRAEETELVREGKLTFEVNLRKYLDTGLFLDHRPLRRELLKTSAGKRVLNLFCYTGSLSAAAALGGAAHVTSVDMSATYLKWAERNMRHNAVDPSKHAFVQADVVAGLRGPITEKFDVILLDPPSFSNSKRMDGVLDVQEDHPFLVRACLARLAPGGRLFFSTNKRRFKLDPALASQAKEITHWTVPPDFAESGVHKAWEFRSSAVG